MYEDSRENLLEFSAVAIILSPISSVRDVCVFRDSPFWVWFVGVRIYTCVRRHIVMSRMPYECGMSQVTKGFVTHFDVKNGLVTHTFIPIYNICNIHDGKKGIVTHI